MTKYITADSRRRITLSNVKPGDILELSVLENGQILLIPVLLVPKRLIKAGLLDDQEVKIIING